MVKPEPFIAVPQTKCIEFKDWQTAKRFAQGKPIDVGNGLTYQVGKGVTRKRMNNCVLVAGPATTTWAIA